MTLRTKPVEGAAHVELFLSSHIEERQVDGGAPGVAALLIDILLLEEDALVEVGIEVLLHLRGREVGSPAHEMVDGLLGAIGIVDFQPVALLAQVVADGAETVGSLLRKQGRGLQIAVDTLAHEVVGAEIANLEDGVGHGISQGDKLTAVVGGRHCHGIVVATVAAG